MKEERSEALWNQAKKRMPGGVNSPVRAYGAVGRYQDCDHCGCDEQYDRRYHQCGRRLAFRVRRHGDPGRC